MATPPYGTSSRGETTAPSNGAWKGIQAMVETPQLAPDNISNKLKQRRRARKPPRDRKTPISRWQGLLWPLMGLLGVPIISIGVLIAMAPPLPDGENTGQTQDQSQQIPAVTEPFRVALDGEHFYQMDLDPRQVDFGLLRGWDREAEAFADPDALAFISGPMYERYYRPDPKLEQVINQAVQPSSPEQAADQGYTVPLGDLKFGPEIWQGLNRAAAGQRAFIAIDHAGEVTFGYGELTAERARTYETFIGGLHVLYNDLQPIQPGYQGAYSKGLGQKIRYYLPRVRVVIGLRPDGRLEVLMSKDGLTLEETRELTRKRGLMAAYLPDHASKSRFIVSGVKAFSEEDANWISGGSVSYVHVPYMIRISRRRQPAELEPNPLAALPHTSELLWDQSSCSEPFSCAKQGVLWAGDRALSGLNRFMGVVLGGKSLPEPPITADPPASQLKSLPGPEIAFSAQEHLNPPSQPWESAWMPHANQAPLRPREPEPTAAPMEVWNDMAEPILVPQDASQEFWEQTFPLLPSLPVLEVEQGIGPEAEAPLEENHGTLHQQPQLLALPALHGDLVPQADQAAPGNLATQLAPQEEAPTQPPLPPPALDMDLDSIPLLPPLN